MHVPFFMFYQAERSYTKYLHKQEYISLLDKVAGTELENAIQLQH